MKGTAMSRSPVARINVYFRNARWWQISIVSGLGFTVWMAAVDFVRNGNHFDALTLGGNVVSGIFFGLIFGPLMARMIKRQAAAIGPVDDAVYLAARRAAWRGPVPADPAVRETARAFAVTQLSELKRYRPFSIAVFGLLSTLSLFLAITDSASYWFGTALFTALLMQVFVWPWYYRRRIALLAAS